MNQVHFYNDFITMAVINIVQSIIISSIINIIYCYFCVILFVEGRVLSLFKTFVTALLLTVRVRHSEGLR